MLQSIRPFRPAWNFSSLSASVAVTAASQAVSVSGILGSTLPRASAYTVRIVNNGTDVVWFKKNQAATVGSNSIPLLPNTTEMFALDNDVASLNFIGATGGLSTIIITIGEGK